MTLPQIQRLNSVDSTSNHARRELSADRAGHLSAWIAEQQTSGRGRRGATWHATPGGSLLMSLTFVGRDSESLPAPPILSMTVAVALLGALLDLGLDPKRVALDWPNDLVATTPGLCSQGGFSSDTPSAASGELPKFAGILIEARNFDPEAPQFVCGIGVNLNGMLPPSLLAERPACTLADLGLDTTPLELATAIQRQLSWQLEVGAATPDQLCQQYAMATGLSGAAVEVELSRGSAAGRLISIGPAGIALLNEDAELIRFALEHIQAIRKRD